MLDAASIMTREVITAGPDATVGTVARLLTNNGISALPICDAAGNLLGMLSEGDLMRPFSQANERRRSWWLTLLAEGTELAPQFVEYISLDSRRARDLMQTDLVTASEKTSAPELAELMTSHKIKRVPILRDGKLVGIVSRADLVRAMARTPGELVDPVG
jgi:CBS domain-containing protein